MLDDSRFFNDSPNLSIVGGSVGLEVLETETAILSVDVTAKQPTRFQWSRNGQAIDGAILSYYEIGLCSLLL